MIGCSCCRCCAGLAAVAVAAAAVATAGSTNLVPLSLGLLGYPCCYLQLFVDRYGYVSFVMLRKNGWGSP